jgi:adenosylcobinamide kinase/adenosylcobinamide-phosphate guanylyltransferase
MTASSLPGLTLVLGGARSGKSRCAEGLTQLAAPPWIYLATAEALDDEMRERIAHHRSHRDSHWQTIETPLNIAEAIIAHSATRQPILIDCLTLWLNNMMLAERDVAEASDRLIIALVQAPGPIVVVSNEVGLGIVPDTPLGRRFRDAQGQLNQRVAAIADRVVMMVAGLPLNLK